MSKDKRTNEKTWAELEQEVADKPKPCEWKPVNEPNGVYTGCGYGISSQLHTCGITCIHLQEHKCPFCGGVITEVK